MVESTSMPSSGQPGPPVGVIESLGKGFETVTSRTFLILIPVVLDFFLWLGPQLSVAPLVDQTAKSLEIQLSATDAPDQSRQLLQEFLAEAGQSLNVFGLLSTAPLGIPSLMVAETSTISPIGTATVINLSSYSSLITVTIVLNLIGLMLGATYFGLIAQQVLPEDQRWSESDLISGVWLNWMRLTGLALSIIVALLLFSAPAFLLSSLLGLLHPALSFITSTLAIIASMWVLFLLAFSMHGIVLRGCQIKRAIIDSVQLVSRNMPAAAALLTIALLITWGLGYLWTIPDSDSWFLIIGLAGHAFITTGLVAASFIFYQDRYRWGREMQDWLKHQRADDQHI